MFDWDLYEREIFIAKYKYQFNSLLNSRDLMSKKHISLF